MRGRERTILKRKRINKDAFKITDLQNFIRQVYSLTIDQSVRRRSFSIRLKRTGLVQHEDPLSN